MTQMQINGSETGVVRLFRIDLPQEEVDRFVTEAGPGEWPVQQALGAERLRPAFVETLAIKDLGGMPLSSYLAEAHGVDWSRDPDARAQVDQLSGQVLILPSQAFGHQSQTLEIRSPLRWVGTFGEVPPTPSPGHLDNPNPPRPQVERPAPQSPRPRLIGMLLSLAALILVILSVVIFSG